MKYIATVEQQTCSIAVDADGMVTLDGEPISVDLQSLDGGFHYSVLVGATSHEVYVERCQDMCLVTIEGVRYRVKVEDERARRLGAHQPPAQPVGKADVVSPMPGVVVAVLVQVGQEVRSGEGLLILEAMKMENEIRAPRSGAIETVQVAPGERVSQDDLLVRIG
jgi:biotin carboxyl carrier protein